MTVHLFTEGAIFCQGGLQVAVAITAVLADVEYAERGSLPWFAFGLCSCIPASLPDYHENHLTLVD